MGLPPTKPSILSNLKALAPLALAILAFALRFSLSHTHGYYPDEGAFTELALSFWRTGSPAIGAVKQTALLPMGCSWLAPALAAPWAGLFSSAIVGVRFWTALLAAASAAGLCFLGQRSQRPLLGLFAALAFAAWPLAIPLGAWGTYHHLAAALLILCAYLAERFRASSEKRHWLQLCWATGLCIAAAYWTFWLGLLPLALAWPKERRAWLEAGLLGLVLPVLLGFAIGAAADPASFHIDLAALQGLTHADLPIWMRRLGPFYALWMVSKTFPPAGLGLLALFAWIAFDLRARKLRPGSLAALVLLLGCADVFRQRQNLEGFAYPLVLALPAMALGLGLVVEEAWSSFKKRQARWLLLGALLAGSFVPPLQLPIMDQLCAKPPLAQELFAKAASELHPGDLVIGQAPLNWGFPKSVHACQFDDVAAANGEGIAFLPAGLPASRFLYKPVLEEARWIIVSNYTMGFTFTQNPCILLGLRAEQLGFYATWSNAVYTVYENPRFTGKRPPYAQRILGHYNLYDTAALEALNRKDLSLALFALQQGLPYPEGDVAGRKRTLEMVKKQLHVP